MRIFYKDLTVLGFCALTMVGCSDSERNRAAEISASGGAVGSIAQDIAGSSSESVSSSSGVSQSSGDSSVSKSSNKGVQASYEEHVLPLVEENCGACHGTAKVASPYFGYKDAKVATAQALDNKKINLVEPEKSRLVLRLKDESHYCWTECENDAAELSDAISAFIKEAGLEQTVEFDSITKGLKLSSRQTVPAVFQQAASTDIDLEAEDATVTGMMEKVEDSEASGGSYVHVANNANNANYGADINHMEKATFNFEIEEAGTYFVWGLIRAPAAGAGNSFQLQVDDNPMAEWAIDPMAAAFQWDLANNGGGDNDATPVTYELAAGPHTLVVGQREHMAQLDRVVLTMDDGVDEAGFAPPEAVASEVDLVSQDISSLINGVDADSKILLHIEVSEISATGVKIARPHVTSASSAVAGKWLHIKKIDLLVNDDKTPRAQYSTFHPVDVYVELGEQTTLPLLSSVMVVSKEKDQELDDVQLKFIFENLELVDTPPAGSVQIPAGAPVAEE